MGIVITVQFCFQFPGSLISQQKWTQLHFHFLLSSNQSITCVDYFDCCESMIFSFTNLFLFVSNAEKPQ